jgi:hypothetical protein
MNKNISEDIMFDLDMTDATTAATTSLKYDMQMYDRAGIAVGVRSTGFTSMVVDLMEATAATAAGSSNACGRAGVTIGCAGGSAITTAGGVQEFTITPTTVITTGTTLVMTVGTVVRPFAYTSATANHNATAWTTAQLYFGCTDLNVAGSVDSMIDVLSSAINSTLAFNGVFTHATDSTAVLRLRTNDVAAAGPVQVSGGNATGFTLTAQQAVVAFDCRADQLSTGGNRYLGIKTSTVGVASERTVAVVRKPGRYMPSGNFKGNIST